MWNQIYASHRHQDVDGDHFKLLLEKFIISVKNSENDLVKCVMIFL